MRPIHVVPAVIAAAVSPEAAAEPAASPFADLGLVALDGTRMDPATFAGKAVLVVNVASRCGFTPQYEGLQALFQSYQERGLVVLGVPCNQFGGQEPGSPEEIATFCSANYGVTFPILEKQQVNGPHRSRLYRWLIGSEAGGGKDIEWNFTKFVIGADGTVIGRFGSRVKPDDAELVGAIERALATVPAQSE